VNRPFAIDPPQPPIPAPLAESGLAMGEDPRCSERADQLSLTMARLHQRGWCDGTGGNFSCVWQRDPLRLLMAPSGVDKGQVQPRQLIVVDGTGQVVLGEGKASAETLLHLEIVARTGAGAVLHTHSQAATLLSQWSHAQAQSPGQPAGLELQGLEMLKGLSGINSHECQVSLPVLANDQDLLRLSAKAGPLLAAAPWGLLIAGHGLYAWGRELQEATRHLEILEFLLEQRWRRLLLDALTGERPKPERAREPGQEPGHELGTGLDLGLDPNPAQPDGPLRTIDQDRGGDLENQLACETNAKAEGLGQSQGRCQ